MTTRVLVVLALAGLFLLAPAMLAPLAMAVGPGLLVPFAAGCFAVAALV